MTELSTLYNDLEQRHIRLFTEDIGFIDAATIEINGQYGIFLDLSCFRTMKNYKECLAHEIGHCATGCTHKVSSVLDLIAKHEYKANRWAIEHYVPFDQLQIAFSQGYTEKWQLSEFFDLPEAFINMALNYYFVVREKKIG